MARQQPGITSLPDIKESLRLLIEEEQYSLIDVAMMFQRSRERIRELCKQWGFHYAHGDKRGLYSIRIWDDENHRFRPVNRKQWSRLRTDAVHAQRCEDAERDRAERRTLLVQLVESLRATLGRDPRFREIWGALTSRDAPRRPPSYYVHDLLTVWGPTRRGQTRAARLREFRAATGMKPINPAQSCLLEDHPTFTTTRAPTAR
jgi:hypothetical protein